MERTSGRLWVMAGLLLALATGAAGRAVERARGPVQLDDADPAALLAMVSQDGGNVRMALSNWGELGNPDGVTNYKGFEYPTGSNNDFLFAGGLWVGAVVNGQRRVSTTTDGDNGTNEYWPVHIAPIPAANGPTLGDWWLSSSVWTNHSGRIYACGRRGADDDSDWTAANDLDGDSLPSRNWDGGYGFIGVDDDGDGATDEELADSTDNDSDGHIDEDTGLTSDGNGDGNAGYDPEPKVDEDPIGDISRDYLDNDHDGLIDAADPDNDGDLRVGFIDDDNDGLGDEDAAALGLQDLNTVYQDSIQASFVRSADSDGHPPLDIEVVQHSYVLEDTAMADVVFVDFTVRNMGAAMLDSVFLALFADPDIGAAGEGTDAASLDDYNYFDAAHGMMVQYDNPTDGDGWGPGVIGFQIVRTPTAWSNLRFSFQNFERVSGGDPVNNAAKYAMISSGTIAPRTAGQGDWRELMGFGANPGGFRLTPGSTLSFTVAMIGAPDTVAVAQKAGRTARALAAAVSGGASNFPPQAFYRVSPPDSSMQPRGEVTFSWTRAIDPDGDSVQYTFATWTLIDGTWQWDGFEPIADTSLTLDYTNFPSAGGLTVRWILTAFDSAGNSRAPENGEGYFQVEAPNAVPEPGATVPATYSLAAYPNPFNPATQITFALPQAGDVTLRVFDLQGRAVATLAAGRYEAGAHTVRFDGRALASGVYFYTLESGSHSLSQKLLLLK